MNHFLVKTDPNSYSAADFKREKETTWDGVHSFAAIGFIKQMKPGDHVYVYESLTTKAIVGRAEVIGEPYKNDSDPRFSWAIRLKFLTDTKPYALKDMKVDPKFSNFALIKQSRLSVMAVPKEIVALIEKKL